MVGEREGILHKREAGKTDSGDVTCTYSRRKGEKRAKFENENDVDTADIEINEIYEHQQLVDKFVQDVIEKARAEYLRQHPEAKSRGAKGEKKRKGKENGQLSKEKVSKKSEKSKDKKRHNYKYSEPVDEKEISEYEQGSGESIQWNPNFGKERKESQSNSFYNRSVSSIRSLLGCCIGKT